MSIKRVCDICKKEFKINSGYEDDNDLVVCQECYDSVMNKKLDIDESLEKLLPQCDGFISWYSVFLIRYVIIKILEYRDEKNYLP